MAYYSWVKSVSSVSERYSDKKRGWGPVCLKGGSKCEPEAFMAVMASPPATMRRSAVSVRRPQSQARSDAMPVTRCQYRDQDGFSPTATDWNFPTKFLGDVSRKAIVSSED